MEQIIRILIYIHAGFGGIALLTGFVSLTVKKGQYLHKKSGLVFYYSMLTSSMIAIVVSFFPNHESPFLFAVGIFTLYFILTGKRALKYKSEKPNLKIDKWISRLMIITGLLMIILPIVIVKQLNIILCVFAIVGILLSIRDLILYKDYNRLKNDWLKLHLIKMIGAYISATTAFIVVNEFFSGLYGWFVPGIIGGLFIAYWIRKVNKKTFAENTDKKQSTRLNSLY